MINILLDDIRSAPERFKWAKSVNEFWWLIENVSNEINILSLDHDLGENQPTGYDLCKKLVEFNIWPKEIYLYTSNPVGRDNMYQLLMRYKPDDVKVYPWAYK